MTAFKNRESDAAVTRFKADFVGNEVLFRSGQFFVTRSLIDGILGIIRGELENNIFIMFIPGFAERVNTFFARLFASGPIETISLSVVDSFLTSVEQMIRQPLVTIRALFPAGPPTQQDANEVRQAFRSVWDGPDLVAALPFTRSPPTLRKAQAAKAFENDRCFDVAMNMARKLLKKHRVSTLAANIRLSYGTIPGAVVKEGTRGPGSLTTQQTIVYSAQSTLDSVATRMRSVIDAGGIIQCGVLSGVRQDKNLFKNPEHYLLVFAHCEIEGKEAFIFWDPDATSSDIASTGWGQGFGCLFHTSGRLSTAIDEADLIGIDRAAQTASGEFNPTAGYHVTARNARRHCYQVYWVQTRPQ